MHEAVVSKGDGSGRLMPPPKASGVATSNHFRFVPQLPEESSRYSITSSV
jgi:hypothetical protein